jgi:HEAT repeat protein
MVHEAALALLLVCNGINDPGDKVIDPQPCKPDQLIADLKSDDRAANDRALTFLMSMAWSRECDQLGDRKKDVVAALLPYLDNVEERKNALMIVGRMGPDAKDAVPNIVRFIKRSTPADDRLALVAQYALRDIGANAATAVPDLIDSFPPFFFGRFNNIQYRRDLPITLVAIAPKDPKVKSLLRKGLQDQEAGVRVHSAWKLWELGERAPELKEIWSKAQGDEDAVVRGRVGIITAWLARGSPELLPLALAALKDPERDVRRETMDMLVEGNFTQGEVMDAYVERLADSDWYVRTTACEGLGKMGGKAAKAIPQLKNTLQDKEMFVRVRGAQALYALDPNMVRTAVEVLTEGLTHSSNNVRSAAAKGLGQLGPAAHSALPALRRALHDDWRDVRKDAAEAIAKIEKKTP